MLKSKHFKTEGDLLIWTVEYEEIIKKIISIVKDVTNGDWIIFYIE